MHLIRALIHGVGSLRDVDLELPFNDGRPLPLVIVGPNGAGKTTFLTQVADALIELGKASYTDIVEQTPVGSPYFALSGGGATTSGWPGSLTLMRFEASDVSPITFAHRAGSPSVSLDAATKAAFPGVSPDSSEGKRVAPAGGEKLQDVLLKSSLTYFPSWRSERPHWLNRSALDVEIAFADSSRVKNQLGKSFVAAESAELNKAWIRDLILDSRGDFRPQMANIDGTSQLVGIVSPVGPQLMYQAGLTNINSILKETLKDGSAQLHAGRRFDSFKVGVSLSGGRFLKSLDGLSAGEAVLFNMFATITRQADRFNGNMATNLAGIEGIALIDEIDAHLDAELQHTVLPSLIGRFPRVQFIVTSHAPLFLLGMEKRFGMDGFRVVELPAATEITVERFSEFERSYEYFKATSAHEAAVREQLTASDKPVILTEGDTDAEILQHALDVLGAKDLADRIEICEVGATTSGGTRGGGTNGLNSAWRLLSSNPALVHTPVVLLYDSDANKPDAQVDDIYVRSLPANPANSKITRGIENLFPAELFSADFYSTVDEQTPYGERKRIERFDKRMFCDWICSQSEPEHFEEFRPVIASLRFLVEPASSDPEEDSGGSDESVTEPPSA